MSAIFDTTPPFLVDTLYPDLRARIAEIERADNTLLGPLSLSSHGIRDWILAAMEAYDIKPTSWAKKAGLAPSTLNRFLKPEVSNLHCLHVR